MATPPEGPALDKQRDTAIDTPEQAERRRRSPSLGYAGTVTPVHGLTSMTMPPSPAASPKELEAGAMVGEYRVEGLLGEGGMGRVYSALHPVIGKQAAIKVLHPRMSANPEVVERFVQEARAVNQIGHPNIVDIFSFGTLPDGQSYFVMEWLKGESLHERIFRKPLTREELCRYIIDITHALDAAHEKGIIHRDLKPDNVFLCQIKGGVQIKLLDFGIAKLSGGEDNRIERTRTGAMMGTPKYIAPEQARGYAIDHRADIYSLGVMLFEIAARRLPFIADNAMDLIASHLHDEPPRMSSVAGSIPRVLDDLVLAMLSKAADQRPGLAQVREVLEEIRTLPPGDLAYTISDLAVPAHSMIEPPRRSRKPLLFAGVALVGVLGGVLAVTQLGGSRDEPEVLPTTEHKVAIAAPAIKAPPPAPAKRSVTIKTAMAGTLLLDDKPVAGSSPWTLQLAAGSYALTFKPIKGDAIARQLAVGDTDEAVEFLPAARPIAKPVKPPKPPPVKPPKPPTGDDDFVDPPKPPKRS